MFLVFRFVNGVGVGMLLAVTPMYQAELSPPRSRGFLVGQHGFFLAVGYNIASWVGLGSYFAKSGALAWRFPLALQALFPIILLIGSIWLPRSPRWLITKDRMEEARNILARLHRTKDDPNDDFSGAEFDLMVAQVQLERSLIGGASGTIGRWKTLFSRPSYRKRAILGFGLMFGMQGVAPLVINNYQVILFPRLGVGPALSLGLYSVYLGIALVGNFTCGLIIDRLGRRMCFFIGLTGCLCALTGEAIFTSFAVHSANKVILGFGVFFIFFYIPWWSTFCDPSIYIYISEIWPSEIRSEGIALSTSGTQAPSK
jgi:MFS family permease